MASEVDIVVKVTNRTQGGLRSALGGVVREIRRVRSRSDTEGRGIGSTLARGIGSTLISGLKLFGKLAPSVLSAGFSGALKGALSPPVIGPIITAALVGAVAIAAPAVGAAIAGALALGFGTAFLGVGALLLAQDEKIKKQITDDFKEVKDTLTDAFRPLTPIFKTFGGVLKDVAKFFAPIIKRSSELVKGPLQRFIKNLGSAFKELGPALEPMIQAFSDILDVLGPQLPGLFKSIGNSFKEIGKTVSENSDLIAGIFALILEAIPPVIDAIGGLTRFFRSAFKFLLSALDDVAGAFAGLLHALGKVPGFGWAEDAANKLDALGDTFTRAKQKIENNEIEAKLDANIRDFDSKLASARRQLKDPNLTKTRKAQLKADIAQLLNAKARAQASINSLHGKMVYLTVKAALPPGISLGNLLHHAAGGIHGAGGRRRRFQDGGVAGMRGNQAIVGEQGPEIVDLPYGSRVRPAGETRQMMNNTQQGPTEIVLRFVGSDKLTKALVQSVQAGSRQQGGLQVKVVGSR